MPAHVFSSVAPDDQRVAVQVFEVAAGGPQHQHRLPQATPGGSVGALVLCDSWTVMEAERDRRPVLVVIGGLPAAGKTTIAAALARQVGAAFLRVDSIEQAILRATSLVQPVGPVGYVVGYALAGDQLRNGLSVVAESVNPLAVTREAWREAGLSQGASVIEVEVICSDPVEHRRRAESRTVDITDLSLPTWQEIVDRDYHAWDRAHLVLDTSVTSVQDCVATIRRIAGL